MAVDQDRLAEGLEAVVDQPREPGVVGLPVVADARPRLDSAIFPR
jgi:hypothetical protein